MTTREKMRMLKPTINVTSCKGKGVGREGKCSQNATALGNSGSNAITIVALKVRHQEQAIATGSTFPVSRPGIIKVPVLCLGDLR